MKINNSLPFMDTILITKDMCELVFDEKCDIAFVPVKLNDNGVLTKYTSVVVCKEKDVDSLKEEISNNNGVDKDNFKLSDNYCHITTFKTNKKKDFISFDKEDEFPIKADFNKEYNYIDNFFMSFIKFRNNLIRNNQVIKHDDIYQYFSSVIGFSQEKRAVSREKIIKAKSKR